MSRNLSSRLLHRMQLENENLVTDGAGGFTRSWATVANVWAEIMPAGGSGKFGRFEGGRVQGDITHRINLRYQNGVTCGMRLVGDGKYYLVRAVFTEGKPKGKLQLLAEEKVDL